MRARVVVASNRPKSPGILTDGTARLTEHGSTLTIDLDPSAALVVRPILEPERIGRHAYVKRHHYLGDCRLVGESMRHVALLGDELVALLAWGAATLCNEARNNQLFRSTLPDVNQRFPRPRQAELTQNVSASR